MNGLWGYVLRLAVSAALVWGILSLTDGADALRRLARIDWGWIALAFAAITAQNFAMALRWHWVSDRLGVVFPFLWGLREYYLANLVNMTLPGGVLGDAARAYRARDAQSGALQASIHAVMIERFIGQITIFSLLALGMIISLSVPGGIAWPGFVQALVPGVLAGIVLIAIAACLVPLPPTIRNFLTSVRRAVLAPGIRQRQAGLAVVIAALNFAGFYASARATGTSLPPEAICTLIPLILTAMLMPISVGGWGWREGAAAALFPLVGATSGAGVAAGMAFGLVLLASSLPGAVVMFGSAARPVRHAGRNPVDTKPVRQS